MFKSRPQLMKELDIKCAEGITYPDIIAWLDQVSPGHGLANYNLSRHLAHIRVPVQSRVLKKEPPVKFSRSDSNQARMDSRQYDNPQQLEQITRPTRSTIDKRKATDIAGEMNASIQEIVEEINYLKSINSDEWTPGQQKQFADLQEKKLKYLVAISQLKTVAGETILDYKAFVNEMGILEQKVAPEKPQSISSQVITFSPVETNPVTKEEKKKDE